MTTASDHSVAIRLAEDKETKEAIDRLRYQVHIEEMGKTVASADHESRQLKDSLDEGAIQFYAETDEGIIAALRLNFGDTGLGDETLQEEYELARFSHFSPSSLSFSSRLVVAPEWRGHAVLARLLYTGYEYGRERGVQINFCNCAPALLQLYERLGYRRYKANFTDSDVGYRIPLLLICEDVEHFQTVRSPFLRLSKKWTNSPESAQWFCTTFPEYTAYVNKRLLDVDESFWEFFDQRMHAADIPLLQGLTEEESKAFVSSGTILTSNEGDTLIREGDVGNEMFLILSGVVDVRKHLQGRTHSITLLGQGDIFGEMGLISRKTRSADVLALAPTEMLVITQGFLEKTIKTTQGIASKVLYNLSLILCERLRLSSENWVMALNTQAPDKPDCEE